MLLSPLLRIHLRPAYRSCMEQTRHIRPSIKIGKEIFELTVDVRQFNKDEICVKARPEYVIIEGKQERKTKRGFIMRQFVRKYRLPQGCSPDSMESRLTPDGILTITAPRKTCDIDVPCETVIPVTYAEQQKDSEKSQKNLDGSNACRNYLKVKPVEKKPI